MTPRFCIGIDLGTTNSVLAYSPLDDAGAASQVLAVPQWASPTALIERATLPSFLYLPGDDVRRQMRGGAPAEGDWIVGQFAKAKAQDEPGRVAHSAKSWLCHHGADREAAFLPWGSRDLAAPAKISPVRASALILSYLRGAWNDRFAGNGADWSFDAQDVTITVPASFDAAAQRLTLMAAAEAGYPDDVRLLEEPQAAFYTWLEQRGGEGGASQALASVPGLSDPGHDLHHVLVVDIGGGTSDFSLFAIRREDAGITPIRRVAVSEHILLGGDNIDLALAHALEPRLAGEDERLDAGAWDFLVARCRELKEQVLGGEGASAETCRISIPGRGSGLMAGTRTAALSRGEIDHIVLDGFFPECSRDAAPKRIAVALQEWGLPFAADSAITRHLAHFLEDRPPPDAVLFNGGALYPPLLRRRLCEQIGRWQGRQEVPELVNETPDLAVARGAARFGRLLRKGAGRIAADAARAIFLEVQARKEGAAGPALVCVLPQGAATEETVSIEGLALELRINRPVRFQAYASARHEAAAAGWVIEPGDPDLQPLPPLETIARVDRPQPEQRTVAVALEARMSELGLLELACRSIDPALRETWPLAFNLRAGGRAAVADGVAGSSEANAPAEAIARAEEAIARRFARGQSGRDRLTAARLLTELEKILGRGKGDWNWVLVRSLWPSLAGAAEGRERSPEHEETWLILTGFLLRPGFGAAADETRMDELWEIQAQGLRFPGKRLKLQQYILWRRLAGGLSRTRQEAVLAEERNQIRRQKTLPPELVRMTGAFERLPVETKAELVDRYIEMAGELARAGRHAAPCLAALGMLLNRAPLYAGPEDVVPPELVERAYDAFARLDWADPELVELQTLFLRAARVTGSRALDVRASVRNRIAGKLEKLGMAPARTARLKAHMPITPAERLGLIGEALPPGLILSGE